MANLLVLLVYLQGAAVIFRLGRHHHRGSFCEGRGLTHALTDTPPTDLTVATHSPLGAQPQSDRILRVLCGRLVWQVTNHWLVWQVGVQVAGWLLLTLPL